MFLSVLPSGSGRGGTSLRLSPAGGTTVAASRSTIQMSPGMPVARLLRLHARNEVERPMMNGVGARRSWVG